MDAATDRARRGLRHVAGFEGLRGIGLAIMLLYHGGYTGIKGAIFTVSMFFTLSGYLITALIRDEHIRTSAISFRKFWVARARRLLPAGLLTLLGVLIFRQAFTGIGVDHLRGDVLAALGYIENWWLIHTDQSYGAIFGQSSPVQNFWSLAIEEQFYLLLPLLWVGLHRIVRSPRGMGLVFAGGAIASFVLAASVSESWGLTRTYFGTDTRAGELLLGVALAHFITGHRIELTDRGRSVLNGFGILAAIVMGLLWWRSGLNDWFTFHGGTALNAVATCVIIVALLQPGLVTSLTGLRPLRWLGRLSYGIYLVHWPIFLWLNPNRIDLDQAPLFALRLAVTLAVATVVYGLVELPIRHRRILPGRQFAVAMIALTLAIVVGSLTMTASGNPTVDLSRPEAVNAQLDDIPAAPANPALPRVLVVGDSTSWSMSVGLEEWGETHGVDVDHYFSVGCGIGGDGILRYIGIERRTPPDCKVWHETLTEAVDKFRPDIVLVLMGLGDLSPRQFGSEFRSIGNRSFDRFLRDGIARVTRDLASSGAEVVWATYPYSEIQYQAGSTGQPPFVENDRARMDQLNTMIKQVVGGIPGTAVIDFAAYSHERPGGDLDPGYRPDGVHLVTASTREVADWLGPQLKTLAR